MILWIEGCEGIGMTTPYPGAVPAPAGVLARKYGAVNGESFFRVRDGRISGRSLGIDSYGDWIKTPPLPTTNNTMVVGLGYLCRYLPGYDLPVLRLYDGTTQSGLNAAKIGAKVQ